MTQAQFARLQSLLPLIRSGTLPLTIAAQTLTVGPRQLRRYLRGHGWLSRNAWNRLDETVRQDIIALKQEQPRLNCQWISEIISERHERIISQSSVWRILHAAGLLDPVRSTPIVRTRFEAKQSGDLVQLDTSWGYWLNNERLNLILLLDDYSRYILAAEFFWEDGAYPNMCMIRDVLQDYGLFRILYTDNASFFRYVSHQRSIHRNFTQATYESEITRACRSVGITHMTHRPYQPQGKGKIERLFRFIQERLISQLEAGMDLEQANLKLWEWVDWYHDKHVNRTTGMTPKKRFDPAGFTPLSGKTNLDDIFCFKDTRKVDKCNQFSYDGHIYTIPKADCLVACTVDLHIHPDRRIRLWHQERFVCELPVIMD